MMMRTAAFLTAGLLALSVLSSGTAWGGIPDGTSEYTFMTEHSSVTQTGGIAGVHEIYPIEWSFRLTVDLKAGTASFDRVESGGTAP